MKHLDKNPNFVVKAMVLGAVRTYGVDAPGVRVARQRVINFFTLRGIAVQVRTVTPRGNPHLRVRCAG